MSTEQLAQASVGNLRMVAISMVAGAAEMEVDTNLNNVVFFVASPKSVTTSFYAAKQNVDSSGVASLGVIGFSGLTSGDEFHITAFGN